MIFILIINSITAITSKNISAIFYPFNIQSRTLAAIDLLKFITTDSGITSLFREKDNLSKHINMYCEKYNLDCKKVYKLIEDKTNFNPYIITKEGNVGLLLFPVELLKKNGCNNPFNVDEYLDSVFNILLEKNNNKRKIHLNDSYITRNYLNLSIKKYLYKKEYLE
ncbi:MAG: hypothetical protein SVN78_01460 [Deferribacterota bacterium]|nr:hypothetical protein [Deferribacterota bacterium]